MFIYENYINKKICKTLIDLYENSDDKIKRKNPVTDMSQIVLNKNNPKLISYNLALDKILEKYKKKYKFVDRGQQRWEVYENIKIQKYEPGQSYFGWHCESTGYEGNNDTILVFSTYLNTIKKGGETAFFYQKEKIKPMEGKTILFPSFWTHTHKGNITKETKYIITGWYTYVH